MYNLPDITFTIQFSYICVLFVSGWHHRLNNRAGHKGLTFYKLVPLLRKEAQQVTVAVRLMANGQGGRDQRPTYRRLDSQVQELWKKYSSGEISTKVAERVKPVVWSDRRRHHRHQRCPRQRRGHCHQTVSYDDHHTDETTTRDIKDIVYMYICIWGFEGVKII